MVAETATKEGLRKEIAGLSHIGRSAEEIERTLSAMGYDGPLLKEILTFAFMKSLIMKEEMYFQMQQAEARKAAAMTEDVKRADRQQELEGQAREQKLRGEALKTG